MAESEGIQAVVKQAAIQVVTLVMMALTDADVGPQPATTAMPREPQRHDWPALEKALIQLECPGQVCWIT